MFGQCGEARNVLRPPLDHLHGPGEQIVKLRHALGVVFRTVYQLLAEDKNIQKNVLCTLGSSKSSYSEVRRVRFHVGPDEDAQEHAGSGRRVLGRQTSSPTSQTVCPHHCDNNTTVMTTAALRR